MPDYTADVRQTLKHMNVLFVASECAPFVKTGGLADVIGAVPKALASNGINVKVMLPAYPALAYLLAEGESVLDIPDLFGAGAQLVAVSAEGLDLLLLNAPHLYDRPGNIYVNEQQQDWADNHLRFGALSMIGARVAAQGVGNWTPDVVNAHDWQAGLLPAYLKQEEQQLSRAMPPVVMTVHNIAFQGLFDQQNLDPLLLSPSLFTPDGIEYFGQIGFLKAGLALADKITTVSPTYARELLSPEFGMGLEGLLRARADDLTGILNGIDTDVWNPATDPNLIAPYSIDDMSGKRINRNAVESKFGLESRTDAPLFCVVSRLTEQKGLDLLLSCLPTLVNSGARLALLGSGEKAIEQAFLDTAKQYPGYISVTIGYDEGLSHLMQGGSDAILIPSRFEPCGLTQLYGLRYGTIPVVARTGGLADTVIDANEAALVNECATGFQFSPVTAQSLDATISQVCAVYKNKAAWDTLIKQAMQQTVDWNNSATAYLSLYQQVSVR